MRNRLCRDPACRVKPLPPPPLPPFLFFSLRSLLLIAAPGQPRRCLRCDSDNRYWLSQELQRLFWGPLEIGWIYAYVLLRRIAIDVACALVEISLKSVDYFYSSTIFYALCWARRKLRNLFREIWWKSVEFDIFGNNSYLVNFFTIYNYYIWIINKNRINQNSMHHSFSPRHLVIFLQVRLHSYIIYSLSQAPF